MKLRPSSSRTYNRIKTARHLLRVSRDRDRVDAAADPVCSCGWISGEDACPMCGGIRVEAP